jgi:hypothetical protein
MSIRRAPPSGVPSHVAQLQKDLADLKSTATAAPVDALQAPGAEGSISFDSLSENEKSAASLGVHPESWKPIVRHTPHATRHTPHARSHPLTLVHDHSS